MNYYYGYLSDSVQKKKILKKLLKLCIQIIISQIKIYFLQKCFIYSENIRSYINFVLYD